MWASGASMPLHPRPYTLTPPPLSLSQPIYCLLSLFSFSHFPLTQTHKCLSLTSSPSRWLLFSFTHFLSSPSLTICLTFTPTSNLLVCRYHFHQIFFAPILCTFSFYWCVFFCDLCLDLLFAVSLLLSSSKSWKMVSSHSCEEMKRQWRKGEYCIRQSKFI